MKYKLFGLLIIIMFQNGSCLDVRNCTNSSLMGIGFTPNPKMKFYLFTKQNFFIEQEIFIGNKASLDSSNFNPQWPVRIIVHGWQSYLMGCINGFIKDAYLKKGNFNVIVVDWGDWSRNVNYFAVVPYIFNLLGPLLAKFIKFLNLDGKIPFDNIYLIGHSLGAHMSGSAGQNLRPNKINTIFGLDPAGIEFLTATDEKKLSADDGAYVEQITTNMIEFGYQGVIGTAAFYPNYGSLQPYCIRNEPNVGCSHSTSILYFAESINTQIGFCGQSCPFRNILLGLRCPQLQCPGGKKTLMGGEPSTPKVGTFLVKTNNKPNFAQCNC